MSTRQSTKVEIVCETCGSSFFVKPSELKRRNPRFCSQKCRLEKYDITGQTFGYFVVTSKASPGKKSEPRWLCKCKCGATRVVHYSNLKSGTLFSCGCYAIEISTKHGHSRRNKLTGTYHTWQSMHNRCHNEKFFLYKNYGGRGISVCERWKSFENFLEDMGERPPDTSIDRFPDQDGNYEKSNCRWATRIQQARNQKNNRIIEFDGEIHCLSEWSEILGINLRTLLGRLSRGWSIDKAFTRHLQR